MNSDLLAKFIAIVGSAYALTPDSDLTRYTHENRGLYVGKTPIVLKPRSTQEVAKIMALASETSTPVVPQGGHTGHVGGGVPDESEEQIVISMERMNRVREIDCEGNVLICEAGCVLESIQKLADDNDRLFPLSLGSQGSCQIGGNISTNAGGTGVLAYGNMRQLVMGLEVVLPSGKIWNGLRRLKKDNSGYDLKDLFIGAEGTLGVITAAVLKLFPKPKGQAVAWCGMDTPAQALDLFSLAHSTASKELTAFELMEEVPVSFTFRHMENVRNPLSIIHPWQVLIEISSARSQEDAELTLQGVLETAFGKQVITDAALSGSLSQAQDFWRIRELMPIAQKSEGGSMKHDVSVPLYAIPEFLERGFALVHETIPQARSCVFGHMGDGNMHFNISQPEGVDASTFLSRQEEMNNLMHNLVLAFNGSVAAEHGVGRLKRDLVARTKDPIELSLMKDIKRTLDPQNIMNPGKVVLPDA